MGRDALGEFEHRVLLALLRLGQDAYSAPVVTELEARTGRPVKSASVYIALRRLEEKGLVVSTLRSPGAEGGRDRRHFLVTEAGREKIREEHATYMRLVEGMDEVVGGA